MYRARNTLTINTNITDEEVKINFSKNLTEAREKNNNNMIYFQKYIRFLFDTEISENEYVKIFDELLKLKASILFSVKNVTITAQLFIRNIMKHHDPYYVNNTRQYLSTQVFIAEYLGKKCIVKIYIYNNKLPPEYNYIVEHNFENEVLYQTYARTLNEKCGFISPEIYDIGQIKGIYIGGKIHDTMKCRFIIMEYLPFIHFNDAIFNENACAQLIERKNKLDVLLKTKLLHHNDLHGRNILFDWVHDMLAIIDFGESNMGPLHAIK